MSTMVSASEPFTVVSAVNVAVIVACEPAVPGATYVAVAGVVGGVTGVSVPGPLRLQVTAVVGAFDTVAVSVRDWVGKIAPELTFLGELMVTSTVG
jgi:hypothetical protein